MSSNKKLRAAYICVDIVMSFIGVFVFDIIRYFSISAEIESRPLDEWLFHDTSVVWGLIIFPVMMIVLYAVSGFYNDVRAKARTDDFRNTFAVSFVGMLVFYFIALINDYLPERIHNYELILILWMCLAIPVFIGRIVITGIRRRRLIVEGGCFKAVIVGTPDACARLKKRLAPGMRRPVSLFRIENEVNYNLPIDRIVEEIRNLKPDSILVTQHPDGVPATTALISRLYSIPASIYITPDLYNLMTARTRTRDVTGEPLINITSAGVPESTKNIKRISDIVGSALALTVLSPVLLATAIAIKLDSRGPVFYRQERIGLHKRPFNIIKFRTMNTHAEDNGPALSSENDPRITRVGRFLRKYRLDELPQFWNVLRGEMSLVGPRPERKFFIDQIVERVPQYSLIHQVRPGITSWGMVKYGYASNIDEMVERLYYDMFYIENISFSVDIKIILHTLNTVLSGRGV